MGLKRKKRIGFAVMPKAKLKRALAKAARVRYAKHGGRTGFALLSKTKLARVRAKGRKVMRAKHGRDVGFALLPPDKMSAVAKKAGRASSKSRRAHRFSNDERIGGNLMQGQFFHKLALPLPSVIRKWVVVPIAADMLGVTETTIFKWIRNRTIRGTKQVPGRPPFSCYHVEVRSIRNFRTQARKKYAKFFRRALKQAA